MNLYGAEKHRLDVGQLDFAMILSRCFSSRPRLQQSVTMQYSGRRMRLQSARHSATITCLVTGTCRQRSVGGRTARQRVGRRRSFKWRSRSCVSRRTADVLYPCILRRWRRDLRSVLRLGHCHHRLRATQPARLRLRAEPAVLRRHRDSLGDGDRSQGSAVQVDCHASWPRISSASSLTSVVSKPASSR